MTICTFFLVFYYREFSVHDYLCKNNSSKKDYGLVSLRPNIIVSLQFDNHYKPQFIWLSVFSLYYIRIEIFYFFYSVAKKRYKPKLDTMSRDIIKDV